MNHRRTLFALVVVIILFLACACRAQTIACAPTDGTCTLQQPYCTQYTFGTYYCTPCNIISSTLVGGGSCQCNPATSYCSVDTVSIGVCVPYTIYGQACTKNSDCQTTGSNVVNTGLIEQIMYCVNFQCKPCSPALWKQYAIANMPNYTYTCPGYSATLTNSLGRYATVTPMSAFTFQCLATGDIAVINATVDYNYQRTYSYGSTATTTTTSAAVVAATTSGTGATATMTTTHVSTVTVVSTAGAQTSGASRMDCVAEKMVKLIAKLVVSTGHIFLALLLSLTELTLDSLNRTLDIAAAAYNLQCN